MNKTHANILRFEGFLWMIAYIYLFQYFQGSWKLFFLMVLAPDIGLVGYLINSRVGAFTYNLMHTESSPIILAIIGIATNTTVLGLIALVWLIHINVDRLLGIGLKHSDDATNTHLGKINWGKKEA